MPRSVYPDELLKAGEALLFSPMLDKADWLKQLEILKKHKATLSGIITLQCNASISLVTYAAVAKL